MTATTQTDLSEIDRAKLLMAEVHYILLTKEKGHELDTADKLWKSKTEGLYIEFADKLPKENIEMALAMARLQGKTYYSQVTGTAITGDYLNYQFAKIADEKDSGRISTVIDRIKNMLT